MDAQVVQALVNIGHCAPPLRRTVECRKQSFIVIASDGIFKNRMQIHGVQLSRTDCIQILVLHCTFFDGVLERKLSVRHRKMWEMQQLFIKIWLKCVKVTE